ncbi:uncharacterized protein FIBRA_05154 [Fibroporia radiculosa]|uniref:SET domain-containing protein n=1 Tax=Fibroporia radiculosa TaxID=599839 RepID=J4HX19_9APHY|nr:uncharacterized protein FIBRA_05154 [Fibroporia radiculosa]CCM03037.1 predicted protein [Fibroporia radiculosa]
MSGRLHSLLSWSSANNIHIDPRIHLVDDPHTGIAIYADEFIPPNNTLVSIPKSAILSVRACSAAERISFVPYGHDAQLALALALHIELLRESKSRWSGYLQSLPQELVPIAFFWGMDKSSPSMDSFEAKEWLIGTGIEKELLHEGGSALLDEITAYYETTAYPLISALALASTLHGFLHAYSLVSSRAFLVDAYHGLSMVPIADAFNHTTDNNVHLESNFDVCPTCGSLAECPHDRDDQVVIVQSDPLSSSISFSATTYSDVDTCDMVSVRAIESSTEIFNTYGSKLGNAALLVRYGFALEGNENDFISWDLAEILNLAAPQSIHDGLNIPAISPVAFAALFKSCMSMWTSSRHSFAMDDSSLVYRPDCDSKTERSWRYEGLCSLLRINSDAQISIQLWLCAVLCTIIQNDFLTRSELTALLQTNDASLLNRLVLFFGELTELQLRVERVVSSSSDGEFAYDTRGKDPMINGTVR